MPTPMYRIVPERHYPGLAKPAVPAFCYMLGLHPVPDPAEVRKALPYRLRKAWDRSGGTWWRTKDGDGVQHTTLRDARGRDILKLYAYPFDKED